MIAASLSHACVRTAVLRHLRVSKLDELFVALLPSLNYSFRFLMRSPVRPTYPVGIKGHTCLAVVLAANTETATYPCICIILIDNHCVDLQSKGNEI
jgi:hypothetical protein